ncbi:hypothetical protein GCM10023172_14070 [Hymenobacter ginsengisoli]|uniref:Auto-transporter adhesin head GIN domain-containing protein n=1 Tax=Hymenobacter ginsengisoli TaxID=1051626 RepID=A0ABP8Q5W9_9BACT|nr:MULTISPECIES: hypothetical protein [unclassified Hymenobacter]MBO2033648.1 hypothetical protein [Hymenobacter sp. BT559]
MKTSIKLLLAAFIVLLASLTAYNMALRAEYRSGAYKDPLRGYTALAFKNFTEVDVPAAGLLKVKIMAGPFGVWVHPSAGKVVRVSQQGGRLVVAAVFPDHAQAPNWGETVVISCPNLVGLQTNAECQVQGHPERSKNSLGGRVLLQGFTQDSLALRQDWGSRIELTNNRLGLLRATAGATPGSHPILQVNGGNRFAAASLTLDHQSELVLNNVQIGQLHHRFGDSTKVTLTGAALGSVLK